MKYDDYSGAIDHRALQRRLERCEAQDAADAFQSGSCARATVRDCVCPCVASEETICNALTSSVAEAMLRTGHCV